MIKFSIIVPVYNSEKYLIDCVDSLLNQTYKPYEIILIDDESKDNSPKLCDELVENNSAIIKCIHKKNAGPLSARIDGIKNASGDYLYFVDSDDILELDALETFKFIIEEENPDGIFFGAYKFIEPSTKINLGQDIFNVKTILDNKRDFYKTIFLNDSFFAMWRKLFKAELFNNIDYSLFINVRHGEDLLQSLQLLKKCKKIVGIDKRLYCYRINLQGLSHVVNFNIHTESIYVYDLIYKFLVSESVFLPEDWNKYLNRNIYNFIDTIYSASISKVSIKQKIDFFNYVKRTQYYSLFIAKQDVKLLTNLKTKNIFKLFNKNRYKRLILFCNIGFKFKKIIRAIKGVR